MCRIKGETTKEEGRIRVGEDVFMIGAHLPTFRIKLYICRLVIITLSEEVALTKKLDFIGRQKLNQVHVPSDFGMLTKRPGRHSSWAHGQVAT
jgi:hypothetical protein